MNETKPIEVAIRLTTAAQMYNPFDRSPFRERDIAPSVEEFLVGWVRELPQAARFCIAFYLPPDELAKPQAREIGNAIVHYFNERTQVAENDLRELFRIGRRSLLIGLLALAACLAGSQLAATLLPHGVVARVLEESLIIVGWVANWRPIEIYLYDWWPIARRIRLYRRIAAAEVQVKAG